MVIGAGCEAQVPGAGLAIGREGLSKIKEDTGTRSRSFGPVISGS